MLLPGIYNISLEQKGKVEDSVGARNRSKVQSFGDDLHQWKQKSLKTSKDW